MGRRAAIADAADGGDRGAAGPGAQRRRPATSGPRGWPRFASCMAGRAAGDPMCSQRALPGDERRSRARLARRGDRGRRPSWRSVAAVDRRSSRYATARARAPASPTRRTPSACPTSATPTTASQLTVFDNRGICQHSGFCTDRLNTVFHTEGAFVTPSGGRMDEIIRAVRDCPSGALSYAIDGVEARDAGRLGRQSRAGDRGHARTVPTGSPAGSR